MEDIGTYDNQVIDKDLLDKFSAEFESGLDPNKKLSAVSVDESSDEFKNDLKMRLKIAENSDSCITLEQFWTNFDSKLERRRSGRATRI